MEDVQKLKDMQADNSVNQLLRNVLAEVLANEGDIYFQETKGMASGAVLAGLIKRINKELTASSIQDATAFEAAVAV